MSAAKNGGKRARECAFHLGLTARLSALQRRAKRLRDDLNRSMAPGKHPELKELAQEIRNRKLVLFNVEIQASFHRGQCPYCKLAGLFSRDFVQAALSSKFGSVAQRESIRPDGRKVVGSNPVGATTNCAPKALDREVLRAWATWPTRRWLW